MTEGIVEKKLKHDLIKVRKCIKGDMRGPKSVG
jgi:hypothetical protein